MKNNYRIVLMFKFKSLKVLKNLNRLITIVISKSFNNKNRVRLRNNYKIVLIFKFNSLN